MDRPFWNNHPGVFKNSKSVVFWYRGGFDIPFRGRAMPTAFTSRAGIHSEALRILCDNKAKDQDAAHRHLCTQAPSRIYGVGGRGGSPRKTGHGKRCERRALIWSAHAPAFSLIRESGGVHARLGKKSRRERIEKRDTFAAKRTKAKRKNQLIAAGVLSVVAVIVTYSAYTFATSSASLPGAPPGSGPLGGEHEHASILTKLHGDTFDFSGSSYQVQNNWIHFENQDGTTIHRHAANVTLGYLFESLSIGLSDECYIFPDGAREFCTDDRYSLKFYLNEERVDGITDHVPRDGDRILISYGSESDEEIEAQLRELGAQAILS